MSIEVFYEWMEFLWVAIIIPIVALYKDLKKERKEREQELRQIKEKAFSALTREQIVKMINDELKPIVQKQIELQGDFKQVNRDMVDYVNNINKTINDLLMKLASK